MQIRQFTTFTLFVALMTAAGVRAAEPPAAVNGLDVVKPFVRAESQGVVYFDLARVDPAAIGGWVIAGMSKATLPPDDLNDAIASAHTVMDESGKWIGDFTKGGGRHLIQTMFAIPGYGLLIAPLAPGGNARAIQGLLFSGRADGPTANNPNMWRNPAQAKTMAQFIRQAEVVGNAVAMGNRAAIDSLSAAQPADRSELTSAFEAAGDAPAVVVAMPSDAGRTELEKEAGQTLPSFLGGGPTITFTRGIEWAILTAQPPPKAGLNVIAQCKDADTAKSVSEGITAGFNLLMLMPQQPDQPNWAALTTGIRPVANGNRVTLSLDAAGVEKMMPAIASSLAMARRQALAVQSMSNLRQLCLASIMYSNDHNGDWPDDMDAVLKSANLKGNGAAILKNPLRKDLEVGYVYVKPTGKAGQVKPDRIVFYEAADEKAQRVGAAFADGHSEILQRAEFERRLKQNETGDDAGGL